MATWKVNHYYYNPRNNREEEFDNKTEAMAAALGISSDDPNDKQSSYIENLETGEWGERTWGKKRIKWHKAL